MPDLARVHGGWRPYAHDEELAKLNEMSSHDALEFEACLCEMGYGAVANKIFRDLDKDASGTVT